MYVTDVQVTSDSSFFILFSPCHQRMHGCHWSFQPDHFKSFIRSPILVCLYSISYIGLLMGALRRFAFVLLFLVAHIFTCALIPIIIQILSANYYVMKYSWFASLWSEIIKHVFLLLLCVQKGKYELHKFGGILILIFSVDAVKNKLDTWACRWQRYLQIVFSSWNGMILFSFKQLLFPYLYRYYLIQCVAIYFCFIDHCLQLFSFYLCYWMIVWAVGCFDLFHV